MRLVELLVAAVVVGAGAAAYEFGLSKTLAWDEDVLLADGKVLSVHRTTTRGPDGWFRAGRGQLTRQTIRFAVDGREVEWKSSDKNFYYLPDALDFVNGMPVVVMPIHGWPSCYEYDFPLEGFVAFGFERGSWKRVPSLGLPKDLKLNLLQATENVQYWYRGKRVTLEEKQSIDKLWKSSTKQGLRLSEASKVYSSEERACARLRPPPDKEADESRQLNASAEANAASVVATVVSIETEPRPISKEAYREQQGEWTGAGYLAPSCRGFVEKIEPLHQWSGNEHSYGGKLVGYQMVLQIAPDRRKTVQFGDAVRTSIAGVTCDETTLYVLRRSSVENLVLHRFRRNGELMDAVRLVLPETSNVVTRPNWGWLWNVVPDGQGNLSMSLVDYSYVSSANMGGTANRRANYVVRFPEG